MTTDPFSDILKLTNAQSVVSGGFTAGGAWAIRFPPPNKIKFFAIVKGHCWLIREEEEPIQLEAGDVFLVSQRTIVLASDLTLAPVEARSVFVASPSRFAQLGEGDDFSLLSGHVQLDPTTGVFLTDVLPAAIYVRASSPQAPALQWLLDQLVQENINELPGAGIASAQLAQLMFVQILRAHLEESGPLPAGWLRAVSDQRLAPALRLMHGEPSHAWRLEELAKAAAMSRTTFASYFKAVAGVAPLAYLTEWRMRLAQRALREDDTPVAVLAQSLGYTSESAFSNAFKRATGQAPQRYRNAARAYTLAET